MRRTIGQIVGMPTLEKVNGFIENHLFNINSAPHAIAKALAFREDGELIITKEMGLTVSGLTEEERINTLLDYIEDTFNVKRGEPNDCI